ncbi:MAG: hypothetical protein IT424_12110 [Pirellulales bacterium]|nr:hypothetical protein [Pirellulales bacterium]
MNPLVAAFGAARANWPDGIDALALLAFTGMALGLPVLGYCAMAVDVRRYLRSLTKTLTVIAAAYRPGRPFWSRLDRPPCLESLELDASCTAEQVLAAYRQRVKRLHPDHGGDLQQFLRLQKHFEQAMYLARSRKSNGSAPAVK